LLAVFTSPIAWVVLAAFVLLNGVYFHQVLWVLSRPAAPFGTPMALFFGGSLFWYLPILLFVSAIAMRTFAEEVHAGTIEPLLTAPVTADQVVAAKFAGAAVFHLAMWLPTLAYPLMLWRFGDPAPGPIAAGYLGTVLFGFALTAIGVAASAAARTQIVAAILSFLFGGLWLLIGVAGATLPDGSTASAVCRHLSVFEMMDRFRVGLVDTRDLVTCLSIVVGSLLAARVVLDLRRSAGGASSRPEPAGEADPPGRGAAVRVLRDRLFGLRGRAFLALALGAVLVVEVNHLSCRHSRSFDLSRGAVYSVSPRMRDLLASLSVPLSFTVLASEAYEADGPGRSDILRRLLDRYRECSARVAVRFIDPDREPAAFAETVRRHRFLLGRSVTGPLAAQSGVVVESGERTAFRSLDELFPEEGDAGAARVAVEIGLASAIVQVTGGEAPSVCWTTGHGEWETAGPEAATLLRSHLMSDGFEVRELGPEMLASGLDRCVLVVVGGGTAGFLSSEVELLTAALEGGARLLVMLEPAAGGEGTGRHGFERLLRRAGIEATAGLLRESDPARQYDPGVPTLVVGRVAGGFDRTLPLAGRPVVLFESFGLRAAGPDAGARVLVEAPPGTAESGWGDDAAAGVMASELGGCASGGCGRLVVFGGPGILLPGFADGSATANLAVTLESVAWAAGVEGRTEGPARAARAERVRLFLGPDALRWLWLWLVVGMPAAAAIAGIVVLRARRRDG
jgi:ABC-2 type transport system permease protein